MGEALPPLPARCPLGLSWVSPRHGCGLGGRDSLDGPLTLVFPVLGSPQGVLWGGMSSPFLSAACCSCIAVLEQRNTLMFSFE